MMSDAQTLSAARTADEAMDSNLDSSGDPGIAGILSRDIPGQNVVPPVVFFDEMITWLPSPA